MAKILWYGDALCNTGFGRVTSSVLEHLSKEHEVDVMGINAVGDPHDKPYRVWPAATVNVPDRFGLARIPEIITKVNPDVFICLQDIWVVNQVWERCQFLKPRYGFKFFAYFPIDSEGYYPDMLREIPKWDLATTFTVQSAQRILDHGIDAQKLGVLPHGVDLANFNPMDRNEARRQLNLPLDKFIVLNGNRNQPRKRIDLTIRAFVKFAKDKPDTALYLHMGAKDLGWDVMTMFKKEMELAGLDTEGRLIMTSNHMNYSDAPPDELLNKIYNACDVGLNTANGEGWGLVSFEHASCRKPQVVPNHTVCRDLWDEVGELIDIAAWETDKDLGVTRGIIDVDDAAEKLTCLYEDGEFYKHVADCCYAFTKRPEFRWENVSSGFSAAINDLLSVK
jgi:glycosyltransferase involved in cell wall biosynthesis